MAEVDGRERVELGTRAARCEDLDRVGEWVNASVDKDVKA